MKFVYASLIVLALLVAALFLVPLLLDWEQYKPEIAERLETITGRDVTIDGPLAVTILPTPTIEAADLRIANAPGAAAPDMARIGALDLKLALGPLLGGEIAVTSLELVEPVIELQRLADGRPNWLPESTPGQGPVEPEAGEPAAAEAGLTRIDAARITNGTIVYRHADGAPPERIEGIDATLSARSLDGPYRGNGRLAVRGRAIKFQFATATVGDDRTLPVSLEAKLGGERGSALFEGTLTGLDGVPAFDGSVRAEAADLGALLDTLAVDLGSLPAEPFGAEFSARGALSLGADAIAASELQVRLGESQATGAVSWQGGDVPRLDARIDLNRIDLDRFLPVAGEPEPAGAAAGSTAAGRPADRAPLAPLQTIADDIRQAIPADVEANVDLTIDALTWREGVIRQATGRLGLAGGVVKIRPASALLPGGAKVDLVGQVAAAGDGPWMLGVAEIAAEDLRAILTWLGVDAGAVPADRLRRLSASADLAASGHRISASNFDIRVDTTRIAGDASVVTGERPRIDANVAIDAVNVDAYLVAAGPAPSGEAAPAPAAETGDADDAPQETVEAKPGPAADDPWSVLDEIDADIALTVDALTYGGVRFAGLDLDAALADGDLSVRRAAVDDAAGARVSVTGVTHAVATEPRFDLEVEGAADSLEGVASLLDIDPDIRTEAFGKAALSGTLAGDEETLSLDLDLKAGSAEVSLAGNVDQPFDTPAAALVLGVRAADAAALARAAGLTPPPIVTRLGALTIDGGIGGNLDSVALNLIAEMAGATVTVAGRVTDPRAAPSYSIDVDLAHPQGEALVETLIGAAPTDAALGAVRIGGKVSGDRSVVNFGEIDAAVGESTLAGGVFLRVDQEPPAFDADLQGGVLDLAWLGGGLAASGEAEGGLLRLTSTDLEGNGGDETATAPSRWSGETIDLSVLDRLSGTLALQAEALVLGAYRIDQASVDLQAAKGTLTLRSLTGRLFDGALEADGSLTGGPVPAGQAAFRLVDAEMEDFLRAAAGLDAVSGHAEADGYFTLRGETERAMIRSLAGRVALASGGGTIDGVDVPGISRQIHALSQVDALDDIASFVERTEQSLSSGQTAIRSLAGTVRVQDGQARIDGFEVVADGGVGDVSGTADLPAWQLDLTAQFRLTEHADAPPVGIRFEGPIDAPERRYVIEDMQAHLVKLGLLSLAGAPDMPKITLRKGAKAEPGTEMDELLRNVLGDPDEAEDAGPVEEPEGPEERAGEGGPPDAADARQEEETESAAPSPGEESAGEPDDAGAVLAPLDPRGIEERTEAGRAEEDAQPPETGAEEEAGAAPPAESTGPRGTVPQPPPSPSRYRNESLRDLVDDLLKSLEE
ncbi:MAG: AsmA family protein [Rhodospirillales bacterium]|nr:AsmA family protein [Rhodospirillales bacterium]MDE0381897.1 AsmA family protein [Rhodospirillales bacterium]